MATKLCSKHEATAADQCLLGMNNSKLLIIKKNTGWTGKELIVTPFESNFCCSVAYGESSYYGSSGTGARDDANALTSRMATLWASKTSESWQTGYKPSFAYTARGGCPYMILKSSDYARQQYYLEMGQCRQALHFNVYALPMGTCSSFRAYLRFWNPSVVQGLFLGGRGRGKAFNFSYNKSGYVRYHFDNELCAPNQINATNYGEAHFVYNYGESGGELLACQGYGTSGGMACTCTDYDPWMTRNSDRSYYYNNYCRVMVYQKWTQSEGYTQNPYYADHEITGNALKRLKECMTRKTMWLHIGPINASQVYPASGSGITGQIPDSTYTLYFSRVELRFVLDWAKTNY